MNPSPPILLGKLAVVTGASGSIGSAVAKRLAFDGASVVVHYHVDRENAGEVVRDIVADGGQAVAVEADLGIADGPTTLLRGVDSAFDGRFESRLDVLVNNAGVFAFGSILETSDETFDKLFTVNVRAGFQLAREAAHRMTKAGLGADYQYGFGVRRGCPDGGFERLLRFEIRCSRSHTGMVAGSRSRWDYR